MAKNNDTRLLGKLWAFSHLYNPSYLFLTVSLILYIYFDTRKIFITAKRPITTIGYYSSSRFE